MKKIWFFMVLSSLITLTIFNPEMVLSSLMTAGSDAVTLTIKLLGIYAIWLGIIALVDASGLSERIADLLSPLTDWLFGKTDKDTKKFLSLNLSANLLGLGNASTPTGLKAISGLDRQNNFAPTASTAIIMLIIINATGIQLIPTTVMGLRESYGSASSSDIIAPSIIATLLSTALGVIFVKIISKIKGKKL